VARDNEQLKEEVSSLEHKILELTASRDVQQTSEWYFVDKLMHAEPNRRQVALAVVLPAFVSFVSATLYLLLTQHLGGLVTPNPTGAADNIENLSKDLATSLGIGIVLSILILSWFLAPLPFGFWAGLALPGHHPGSYTLLGLVVGSLTIIGIIGAHMLIPESHVLPGWGTASRPEARAGRGCHQASLSISLSGKLRATSASGSLQLTPRGG
jgi:uncharacterized membrane protein